MTMGVTALRVYVGGVILAAACAAVLTVAGESPLVISWPVAVLMAASLLSQRFVVRIKRKDGSEDVDASQAFMLAILLIAGPLTAVVAQALCEITTNLRLRRPPIKAVFNVAQTTAAVAAAGFVLEALANSPVLARGDGLSPSETGAFVLAALTYQAINEISVSTACALAERRPVLRFLASELRMTWFHAAVSGFAPLTAAATLAAPWLVPVLVAPLWALRRATQAALESHKQARRDALTGLPNALAFREALSAASAGGSVAIARVDLDRFKDINDSLGHRTGDHLLREVAGRLELETAGQGEVFRLQGDDFITLLDDHGTDDAMAYARNLIAAFQVPFLAHDLELEIGISAGVAVADGGEREIEELLRRADVAMDQAKRSRQDCALYRAEAEGSDRARQLISADLRRALAADEVEVHYQPQLSLRTGVIESVEGLVRWRRHGGDFVPPGTFIPQAEHTGVILPLTLHVLRTALADCRRWSDEQGYAGRVGVNLSARTLHHRSLVDDVRDALADAELEPGRLEVEITESALIADPAGAHRTLTALHDLGVDILIDDFGTGYSSLAYLGTLPVDGVKVDRSFVSGMTSVRTDAVIVRSTLDLGRNLGLRVIAEGVEDRATRDRLAGLGCDLAQGWLWSRAVPADEIGAMLDARASAASAA